MILEHAMAIVDAASNLDLNVTLRAKYSGRGMFGKTTAAVIGSQSDIIQSVASAAADMDREKVEDFIQDMALSWDSMGRDMVAY